MQLSSIWPVDRTLSVATTSGRSRLGRDSNKWVLRVLQNSSINGTSQSNCLGHSLVGGLTPLQRSSRCILQPQPTGPQDTRWGEAYPSAEKQLEYSKAPVDWAIGYVEKAKRNIRTPNEWIQKMAQKVYMSRHDWLEKVIYWELCKRQIFFLYLQTKHQ